MFGRGFEAGLAAASRLRGMGLKAVASRSARVMGAEGRAGAGWMRRHPKTMGGIAAASAASITYGTNRSSGRSGVQRKSTGGYA